MFVERLAKTGKQINDIVAWSGQSNAPRNSSSRNYLLVLYARCFLRIGWTNHAIPMLTKYRPIMGAAKMHMFIMSVVGVIIAAMMKITRIA